jgi:mRNA interferase RelE/StbE
VIEVRYRTHTKKYFKKLKDKNLRRLFLHQIELIQNDPFTGNEKKGDLKGLYTIGFIYQGVQYRLAYQIEIDSLGNVMVIILAGPRENFYEELKRYLK